MVTTTTGLATSFIQFSRASLATVTNNVGNIAWAGHNLLLASESFDSSSWTKTTTTVAANSHTAPNSTATAETLTASSANGTTLQSYTALAVSYTFGVWLKRKTGTGNIQIAADSGTYTTVTITSDWALYTVTQTPAAGTISAGVRIVTSGDEVYAWGAHLYRSDLGGMVFNPAMPAGMGTYYPTTPRNLLGFTEDLSNAAWTKTNLTVGSDAIVAPNGLQTADAITASANGVQVAVSISAAFSVGAPNTASVYAKAGTSGFIQIIPSTVVLAGAFANFDLSSGVVGSKGGSGLTSSITPVGDGWYRCSITLTAAATGSLQINMTNSATSARAEVFAGSAGSVSYLWGAQLSSSASLDAYSPQYGAAVTSAAYYAPRLDYDPVTLVAKGLLVEDARSNLITYSAELDNVAWTPAASSISASAIVSPDGVSSAEKIVENSATAVHAINTPNITYAATTVYTVTVYAKKGERNWMYMQFSTAPFGGTLRGWFNIDTGVVGVTQNVTCSIIPVGNGWFRCSMTATSTVGGTGIVAIACTTADAVTSYAGDGTSGLYLWGAQLEASSFATSYIPTGASQVTRVADVASVSTQAFPYSTTAGSWVVNMQTLYSGAPVGNAYILNYDGNTSKRVAYINSGDQNLFSFDGSTTVQAAGDITGSVSKIASAYDATNRYLVSNAGTVASGTVAAGYSSASAVYLGNVNTSSALINGHIRQVTYLPRRISNDELQTRTT